VNQSRQKAIAIGMGYGNLIIYNLVAFILTPVMIVIWGDASYGVYKIILSLMTYFMLIDSGIRNSVVRFISEYRTKNDRDSARRYIATIISFYAVASAVLILLVHGFSFVIPSLYANSLTPSEIQTVLYALPWLILYTIGTLFFNCFTALLRGYNRQITVQTVNIGRSVIRFGVLYPMLRMKCGVVEVISVDALISAVFAAGVLLLIFLGIKLPPKFRGIDRAFIGNIVKYSGVMLVYTFANSLFWSTGNFLVGVMTSSVLAAVYTTSVALTNIFQSLSSAVSQVLVPDIMVKGFTTNDPDRLNRMMVKVGKFKMYSMLLVLIGFGVFGREFVCLWIGEKYTSTYIIAFITMIPLFFGMLQDVPHSIMLARNKHKEMASVMVIAAFANFVCSFLLIKIWGIYGAAIGTVLSYTAIYVVFTYFYYAKMLSFDMKMLYKETIINNLLPFVILVIVGCLIRFIPLHGWLGLIFKTTIFTAVYLVAVFTLLADRKEMLNLLRKKQRQDE